MRLLFLGTIFFCVFHVHADPLPRQTLSGNLGIYSSYFYRGIERYEGLSLQPSVILSLPQSKRSTLKLSLWSHLPAQDKRNNKDFTELDSRVAFEHHTGPGTLSFGAMSYTYSDSSNVEPGNTAEVFAGVSLSSILRPRLSLYQDVDETHARYFEMNFSQPFYQDSYDRNLVYEPYLTLGYGYGKESLYAGDGFNHLAVGLNVSWRYENILFKPGFHYNHADDQNAQNSFWSGVQLSKVW